MRVGRRSPLLTQGSAVCLSLTSALNRFRGCQSIFLREVPDFALLCLPNYTDVMELTKDNH